MPRLWVLLLVLISTYSQVVFPCFQERRVSQAEAEELGFKFAIQDTTESPEEIRVSVHYPKSIYSYLPKGGEIRILQKGQFLKSSEIVENFVAPDGVIEKTVSKTELGNLQAGFFYFLPEHGAQMYIIISGLSARLP